MLHLNLCANQGAVGGGEVMLLAIAQAARSLGHEVTIIAPEQPCEVAREAAALGFSTVALHGDSTAGYMRGLRRWDARERTGILWCNGLRPAVATAGHRRRIVHLHQEPHGVQRVLMTIARVGSMVTLVPSEFMGRRIPRTRVLENWVDEPPSTRDSSVRRDLKSPVIGYLGRLSSDKGVPILCRAVATLREDHRNPTLLLAGESRFVSEADATRVDAAIAALGATAVRKGWMERAEFFESVDLAVFPSVWDEPFGLVVAEAMAARCPFVVSDAGALPEVAGPGYPFVAARDDAGSLAAVIEDALSEPTEDVVDRAQQRWHVKYSPEGGRERLHQLLIDILRKGDGKS